MSQARSCEHLILRHPYGGTEAAGRGTSTLREDCARSTGKDVQSELGIGASKEGGASRCYLSTLGVEIVVPQDCNFETL